MEPAVFLEQKDVVALTKVLIQVLMQNNIASDRYSLLDNAGIDAALIGNLRLDSQPNVLAQALVAEFKRYRIDSRRPDYHPMVNLSVHLCEFAQQYHLSDQDITLFSRLVKQGQENFKTLKNSSTVESTQDTDTVSIEDTNWQCTCTIPVRSGGLFSTVFSPAVNTVIFSNDGKTLFSASEDWNEPIKLWNPSTGQEIRLMGSWKLGRFASIAISPNGEILVIGGTIIELWNLATQQKIGELGSLIGHRDIAGLAISPDNHILASSSLGESPFNFRDYSIKLWRLDTRENICTLNGHSNRVNSLAFSRDGQTLASASKDSKIKLWNLKTFKETYTLTGHQGAVNSIQFSDDNQIIASGGEDRQIKIWNPRTGELIRSFVGHSQAIFSLAISPDNSIIASASQDSSVKVWSLKKMQEICNLDGHSGSVYSVAFSPNGKIIASGGQDSKIKIWQPSP